MNEIENPHLIACEFNRSIADLIEIPFVVRDGKCFRGMNYQTAHGVAGTEIPFNPATSLEDAIWAVEKWGHNGISVHSPDPCLHTATDKWKCVLGWRFYPEKSKSDCVTSFATSPSLAVCAALIRADASRKAAE